MKSIRDQIHDLKKDHSEKTIYFLSSEDLYSYIASLEGTKCSFVHDFSLPKQPSSNSVILMVKEHDQSDNSFTNRCEKINTIGHFDLLKCQ